MVISEFFVQWFITKIYTVDDENLITIICMWNMHTYQYEGSASGMHRIWKVGVCRVETSLLPACSIWVVEQRRRQLLCAQNSCSV